MICTKTLPTRRERLRAFVTLKFEHRLLHILVPLLALLALGLGVLGYRALSEPAPEPVPLGRGLAGVDPALGQAAPVPAAEDDMGSGEASFYGDELAGRPTASGERFDPAGYTAAHRTLPLGSRVRVTHARTGASVVVRINDRGPFHGGRAIDLSQAAARSLGMLGAGTARVRMSLLRA